MPKLRKVPDHLEHLFNPDICECGCVKWAHPGCCAGKYLDYPACAEYYPIGEAGAEAKRQYYAYGNTVAGEPRGADAYNRTITIDQALEEIGL